MKEIKEKDDNFDKIKVFSSEDEKLKLLGELLSNKSSRDIIKLLTNEEYYPNEIANKLNLRPNLVIHHLKKLENLGLLEITNKRIVKKGNEHKYFRINPNLFIFINQTKEEIQEKRTLKKIFKKGIKFFVIGGISFFVFTLNKFYELTTDYSTTTSNLDPLVIPLIIVVVGLVIIYLKKIKEK